MKGKFNKRQKMMKNMSALLALAAGTLFPLNAPEHGMQVIEPVRELFKDEIRRPVRWGWGCRSSA